MINKKEDLYEFLRCDAKALEKNKINILEIYKDPIWTFQIILRLHEYYLNTNKRIRKIIFSILHRRYGMKLGYSIPCNVFGKGLRINHYGLLVINPNVKIGDWCDIHMGVNIGQGNTNSDIPKIGNNVWIGPGVKIFGRIVIEDNCIIGANAVVNKSFEENSIIVGIPAHRTIK